MTGLGRAKTASIAAAKALVDIGPIPGRFKQNHYNRTKPGPKVTPAIPVGSSKVLFFRKDSQITCMFLILQST